MSAVYSLRFAAIDKLTTGSTLLATVPVGFVWVVRDVTVFNNHGTDDTDVRIFGLAGPVHLPIANAATLAALGNLHYDGRQVLDAGDQLEAYLGSGPGFRCAISGYQLATA